MAFTQDDLDEAREEGFQEGRDEGYDEGYSDGEQEGDERGSEYTLEHLEPKEAIETLIDNGYTKEDIEEALKEVK